MIPYLMKTQNDCGPAAISAILETQYERILQAWPGGWSERVGNDGPYDHYCLLQRMGRRWRIVTDDQILNDECLSGQTIVLIHNPSSPTLKQHWTVLNRGDASGAWLHWGDGTIRFFNATEFRALYRKGWPNCAYEVGGPKADRDHATWWEWLVARVTR